MPQITEITPDLVLKAYTVGYFPMAESRESPDILWVCPDKRGIIPLDKVHVPRKLRGVLRGADHSVTCNRDFAGVIHGCAASAPKRPDSWINPRIRDLYIELHQMGFAHSVEVWSAYSTEGNANTCQPSTVNRQLIGGLYGVALGGAFFGESMFSRAENASKIALMHLIARLKHAGFTLLDTQFTNKHLEQFGAVEIGKVDFLRQLDEALKVPAKFYGEPDDSGSLIGALLHSSSVTS